MSLSDRRLFLLSAVALAGCGFTPVYGPDGSSTVLTRQVAFDPPDDSSGFALVRHLERRLGIAPTPAYRLSADISLGEEELGVTSDQTITRYNVLGRVDFVLRRADTDAPVTSGTVESFSSYSATGTPFATQTAQTDANERLMVILGDQIVARLLATAPEWAS